MLSVDLKTVLDDLTVAKEVLTGLGISDTSSAHASLLSIANHGVPLDLLEEIVSELSQQLPAKPDPDLGLKNFERFVISSRSPMSLSALLVRDPSAMSALLDIFSFSQSLSDLLMQDPESFDLIRLTDGQPVAKEILLQELRAEIQSATSNRAAKNRLRRFKQREILRIAYGDLVRKFEIQRTSQQLGYLAETICEAALEYVLDKTRGKLGVVQNRQGQPIGIALIANQRMGAHGADYSSLISLHAIFDGTGELESKQKISISEYYDRLMGDFEDLLAEENEYGACYQIRFERRPMRGSGRACSLQEATKFYDQSATARDRLDLIQSSFLCGDKEIAARFLAARRHICFRSYFSPNDLAELQSLRHGLHPSNNDSAGLRNIKSSPGGLHDLEFTVNFLQLLVGRNFPEVEGGDYFDSLYQLEQQEMITGQEFARLIENYSFMRTVSHRLQLCQAQATDVLPKDPALVRRLNSQLSQHYGSDSDWLDKLQKTAEENLAILAHLLQWEADEGHDSLRDFVLSAEGQGVQNTEALRQFGFQKPETAVRLILGLAEERHRFVSSKRCRFFLASIITELVSQIAKTADPDETLDSLAAVSDSLGGKGTLWELFSHNKSCLELYVNLCANTPYLASILQSNPGMLDELMDSLTLNRVDSVQDYQRELDQVCRASQDILPVVIAYKNSKHLQIGVSQLLGKRDNEQVHAALATVADCCIRQVALNEYESLREKHGTPWNSQQDSQAEFAIVVGGKVGAREPNYHSKATFWILFDVDGKTEVGRNQKKIFNQQFFGLLATRVAKALSQNGPFGRLYELEQLPQDFADASTIAVSEKEFSAKCSKKSTSAEIGMFLSLCRSISESTSFLPTAEKLIADQIQTRKLSSREWEEVWSNRVALESGASRLNLKRGVGGTLDVETLVHFLYAANFSQLTPSTHTISMLRELVNAGLVNDVQGRQLEEAFEQFKKIELYLRLMNLPRRHALPVSDPVEGEKDGEIAEAFQFANKLEQEQSRSVSDQLDVKKIKVQQARLAFLMNYDRFESLQDDVERYQKDNRRIVKSVIDSCFAS